MVHELGDGPVFGNLEIEGKGILVSRILVGIGLESEISWVFQKW